MFHCKFSLILILYRDFGMGMTFLFVFLYSRWFYLFVTKEIIIIIHGFVFIYVECYSESFLLSSLLCNGFF